MDSDLYGMGQIESIISQDMYMETQLAQKNYSEQSSVLSSLQEAQLQLAKEDPIRDAYMKGFYTAVNWLKQLADNHVDHEEVFESAWHHLELYKKSSSNGKENERKQNTYSVGY